MATSSSCLEGNRFARADRVVNRNLDFALYTRMYTQNIFKEPCFIENFSAA
jgi:hypothetical protein